jgi:hypothetical protein
MGQLSSDTVNVLLNLLFEVEGQQELNNFGNAFRSVTKAANSLELGLVKLQRLQKELVLAESQVRDVTEENALEQVRLQGKIASLNEKISDQKIKLDSLSKSYQTQYTNALKSAKAGAAELTAEERASAEAFKLTVPAIRNEIREIEALNRAEANQNIQGGRQSANEQIADAKQVAEFRTFLARQDAEEQIRINQQRASLLKSIDAQTAKDKILLDKQATQSERQAALERIAINKQVAVLLKAVDSETTKEDIASDKQATQSKREAALEQIRIAKQNAALLEYLDKQQTREDIQTDKQVARSARDAARAEAQAARDAARVQAKEDRRGPLGKLLGVDLHTSIYQLSAFYYLLSNVTQQLKAATEKSLEYALAVETLSEQTGISTQTSSAFTLSAEQLGIKVDTVQEAFRTFSDRLGRSTGLFGEPTKGSKDMARAMKELGINVFDANGEVRSLEGLMPEIFDAFQKLGPGIKATAVATALFGQRADEMIPLLIRGSANITDMAKRAQELGLVLTPERTENLRNLTKAFNDVALAGQSMFQTILDGLGPFSDQISQAAFGMAQTFREAFINISARAIQIRAEAEASNFTGPKFGQIGSFGSPQRTSGGIQAGEAAAAEFAKSQGFIPNPALAEAKRRGDAFFVGNDFIPDPNLPAFQTGATSGKPGEDTGDADKLTDKLIALNKKISDLTRDFALESIARARDFHNKQRQELADFQAKQLQEVEDFKTKEAKTIADFDLKQLRDFEDYQIDRDRLLEDFSIKQAQQAEDLAQKRIDLEEETRKKLQDVNDKWDEILLRLRIGGDIDSIRLAEQKRLEALAKAREEETGPGSDLAKFEEDARKRTEIEQQEFDLRLKRLDEDFALRDERRKADFEAELAERKAAFEAEQQLRLDDFNKKQEEDRAKFVLDELNRKAELAQKIEAVKAEIQELLGAHEMSANEEANLLGRRQGTQTELAATGKDDRVFIADREKDDVYTAIVNSIDPISQATQDYQDAQTRWFLIGSGDRIGIMVREYEALQAMREENAGGEKSNDSHPKFAFGGTVPGAVGSPIMAMVHGGERYTPPATSSYFNSVRSGDQISINAPITFSNNVNSDAIAARISNRASRELGRRIAARRAFGG